MKTKIVAILLCIISGIMIGGTFCGCLSDIPTESKVKDIVASKFNIELPKKIRLINYSTEVGFDGGIWYCVFDYDGADSEFNALLTDEKDDEFETMFKAKYKHAEKYFNKDYKFPDLTKNYSWVFCSKLSESNRRIYQLLILFFFDDNQLIVIDDTLQNYDY